MSFFNFRNDISTSTYVQLLISVCIDILMSNGNAILIDSKSKKGPDVGQVLLERAIDERFTQYIIMSGLHFIC